MYIPASFREDSQEAIHALFHDYSFGLLVSAGPSGLDATRVPFLFDPTRGEKGTLMAHMAGANEHWKNLEAAGEVLAVFSGPHAYISPTWYTNQKSVPTWNYVEVHAYGHARLLDREGLRSMLSKMVDRYEEGRPNRWSMQPLPEDFVTGLLAQIVGFEIEVRRLSAKKKLSQNRSAEDQRGVIEGLTRDGHPDSLAVAELMARLERQRVGA